MSICMLNGVRGVWYLQMASGGIGYMMRRKMVENNQNHGITGAVSDRIPLKFVITHYVHRIYNVRGLRGDGDM